MTTYIYALHDPETFEVFDIGKSNKPSTRWIRWYAPNNTRLQWKFDQILAKGLRPIIRIVETITLTSISKRDWCPREKYWIAYYRDLGYLLYNGNDGGGGPTRHTVEAKQRMSRAHIGRIYPPRPQSAVDATTRAVRGVPKSLQHKAKLRESQLGVPTKSDDIEKIRHGVLLACARKRIENPEAISASNKKNSEGNLSYWRDVRAGLRPAPKSCKKDFLRKELG